MKNIITTKAIYSLTAISLLSCNKTEVQKPNILLIQYDDLGFDDIGLHGNRLIETPNMDALGKASVRFNNFYVNPVSAPTRASLLTGRFFLRTGVSHVHGGKDFLSVDEITFANVFHQYGYKTAMWGKWHSGTGNQYYPWQRGFEEVYMAQLYKHRNALGKVNGKEIRTNEWSDKLIVDMAIEFMKKNNDKPFFAYLPSLSPHGPCDAPHDLILKYKNKGLSQNLSTLYAMIDFADQQLGRLLKAIDSLGLAENTIVLLMSDNGPAIETANLSDADRNIRYTSKYKGHKGDILENGVKSPLFIRWKDHYSPSIENQLTDVTDIFPTLLEIAGINYVNNDKPFDGQSFAYLFTKEKNSKKEKYSFNYANPGWPPTRLPYNPEGTHNEYQPVKKDTLKTDNQIISIRNNRYKLMLNPGINSGFTSSETMVLIDMQNDPKEEKNILESNKEIADVLYKELNNWFISVSADSQSFAPPLLFLNDTGCTSIKSTALTNLSANLMNTVHYVGRWKNNGGWVSYSIVAPIDNWYKIVLTGMGDKTGSLQVEVRANDKIIKDIITCCSDTLTEKIFLKKGINALTITIGKSNDCLMEKFSEFELLTDK